MTVKVATPATLPRQAPVIKLRLTLRMYHQRRIMKNYEVLCFIFVVKILRVNLSFKLNDLKRFCFTLIALDLLLFEEHVGG